MSGELRVPSNHRIDFPAKTLALSLCTAAMLAGCGGSQPPIGAPGAMAQSRLIAGHFDGIGSRMLPRATAGRSPNYATSEPLLYVANSNPVYGNDVTVYRAAVKSPAPIATITHDVSSPAGECIDRHGTLYVANDPINGGGWISKYPLGKTDPSATIRNGYDTPLFCAVDDNDNLWVTWLGTPDNVTEYLHDSTAPYFVITNSLTYPDGIAVDRAGNIYVGNLAPPNGSNVEVFASGSKSPSRTITEGLTWPVGIAVDAQGTLYVANDTAPGNIEEYLAGEDQPYKTISRGLHQPVGLAFNAKGWMYVTNGAFVGKGKNDVVEFAPGSMRPSKLRIKKAISDPGGIAHYPAVLP